MAFSVAETIKGIVHEVQRIKRQDPIVPVTIISPNVSLIQSINRALLQSGQAFLNVRIETFYQFVKRHTEPILLENGITLLTPDQELVMIQDILGESHLEYFHAVNDFPSYALYFLRTINELRLSVPEKGLSEALKGKGLKGKELLRVYQGYIKAKEGMADYGDFLEHFPGTDDILILFPGVEKELNFLEKVLLGKINQPLRPQYQKPITDPAIELHNCLSAVQEVKDVFRNLLDLGVPFDRSAVICPLDYIPIVIDEASYLDIPVFCPQGKETLPGQIEIFKSALEVLATDYEYHTLKRFFQLRNHFAPIRAMIECGVAVGGDLLKRSAEAAYLDNGKERFLKLIKALEAFQEIDSLKNQPHQLGKTIVDHFLFGSKETGILGAILDNLQEAVPGCDYQAWERLLLEKLARIRAATDDRKNSIFLTTDFLPGSFDYVFLLGIKEGSFPGKFREDPILLDHEREEINAQTSGTLKTAQERNRDLRDSLETTIACAEKGWFGSFPMMDLISGDEEFPSFYLIDLVRKITANPKLDQNTYQEKLRDYRIP